MKKNGFDVGNFKCGVAASVVIAAGLAISLSACGDDVTKVTEIHQDGIAVLEKGKKLSKEACDTTNVGKLLYVEDSAEVFVCNGEEWLTMKGENGTAGTSCSAKSVKNKAKTLDGIEVSCKGVVVDTIWNGKDGENGNPGKGGSAGASCRTENDGNTISIICGEGEKAESTVILNLCNGYLPYNPETQLCDGRDGKVYGLVKIAGAKVMKENLNYDIGNSYCGGGASLSVFEEKVTSWEKGVSFDKIEKGDCNEYGRLYSHKLFEKKDSFKSICPAGSRLPTKGEVVKLALADKNIFNYMTPSSWEDGEYSQKMNDKYGLGIRAAGYYYKDDQREGFYTTGSGAGFWITDDDDLLAYYWRYYYGEDYVLKIEGEDVKNYGFSVRCVLD